MAGMGFDAVLMDQASTALKARIGPLAYVLSALKHLLDRPMRVRHRHRRRARACVVGCGRCWSATSAACRAGSRCSPMPNRMTAGWTWRSSPRITSGTGRASPGGCCAATGGCRDWRSAAARASRCAATGSSRANWTATSSHPAEPWMSPCVPVRCWSVARSPTRPVVRRRASPMTGLTRRRPVPPGSTGVGRQPGGRRLTLRDGRQVLVRPVLAGDGDALAAAFLRLSPESQRQRFGAAPHALGAPDTAPPGGRGGRRRSRRLRRLPCAGSRAVWSGSAGSCGTRPNRTPSMSPSPSRRTHRGTGLGRVLGELLAAHRPRPARRIRTQIAASNRPAMALLAVFGGSPQQSGDGDLVIEVND